MITKVKIIIQRERILIREAAVALDLEIIKREKINPHFRIIKYKIYNNLQKEIIFKIVSLKISLVSFFNRNKNTFRA